MYCPLCTWRKLALGWGLVLSAQGKENGPCDYALLLGGSAQATNANRLFQMREILNMPHYQRSTAFSDWLGREGEDKHVTDFFPSAHFQASRLGQVDGIPATSQQGGSENFLLLSYRSGSGSNHFLKLIKPESAEPAEQIWGAFQAEKLGGPKVYGFGKAHVKNRGSYFYIDQERLFPGQSTHEYKNLGDIKNLKKYPHPELLAIRMADHFADAIEAGVVVNDPDFIFNDQGEIRWIDSGQWLPKKDVSSFVDIYSTLVTEFMPSLPFAQRLRERIGQSAGLSAAEKRHFLEMLEQKK